jgi:hypothetical protein
MKLLHYCEVIKRCPMPRPVSFIAGRHIVCYPDPQKMAFRNSQLKLAMVLLGTIGEVLGGLDCQEAR